MYATDEVRLEPAQADAVAVDALLALRNNASLALLLLARPRGLVREDIEEWIRSKARSNDQTLLFIKHEAEFCGYILTTVVDRVSGVVEVGLCLTESHRGKGIGGRALQMMEAHMSGAWNMRKCVARIRADNLQSLALFQKCGYDRSGLQSQHFWAGDRFFDVAWVEKLLRS